jgi:ribonucleoside-diphosphate reductase alpha chain
MTTKNPMSIKRFFSSEDKHPYDEIKWDYRDAKLIGSDGKPVFEQNGVRVPESWSDTAFTIAAQKYFRGSIDSPEREKGIDDLISRVVDTIAKWSVEDGYLDEESGKIFNEELAWLCVNQYGAFNSPVWFNVGTMDEPQCSACFILSVQDRLESILDLAYTEAMIFRGGSGSGINFSSLRSSSEPLSGGGMASGPVCFMKGFDSFAGVIKSGGKTRRAAKMVILNADHPDVFEFIESKIDEEEKARALVREGYDGSFDGEAYSSVFFQNANHSIRVSDQFMEGVVKDQERNLVGVSNSKVYKTFKARDLWKKISVAAHKCGDPGLQFDTTINEWHTCPESGRINASNPCSEFMFVDESACNLSSLNLLKFLEKDGTFNNEKFVRAVEIFILAMEVIVDRAGYPTELIGKNSSDFRPLGIGYTNLGGLLMTLGLPYDSDEGRDYAGAITALMSGASYSLSAKLSRDVKGPFVEYEKNKEKFIHVMEKHLSSMEIFNNQAVASIVTEAKNKWIEAIEIGKEGGFRNAQVSLLAPTGTIGFLMDSDSTGIEPMVALVLYKRLVGGGNLKLVTKSVAPGLEKLGYAESHIIEIMKWLEIKGTMEGAPHLKENHLPVFDTALRPSKGTRTIPYMAHLKMMSSVQPFLSGAISKTVNLPKDTSPEEIFDIYIKAWEMGLKSIAIYREGSKGTEPLTTSLDKKEEPSGKKKEKKFSPPQLSRTRLPDERLSITHKFEVGGHEGYLTVGYYVDGTPGELFIAMAKEGSTISGLMDAFAIGISVALQHGVPLNLFCKKYMHSRFEPSGITTNPDIPVASSLTDYIFRWLFLHHKNGVNPYIANLSNATAEKENTLFDLGQMSDDSDSASDDDQNTMGDFVASSDAPICPECGFVMVRNGACYKCMNCGSSSGCS